MPACQAGCRLFTASKNLQLTDRPIADYSKPEKCPHADSIHTSARVTPVRCPDCQPGIGLQFLGGDVLFNKLEFA